MEKYMEQVGLTSAFMANALPFAYLIGFALLVFGCGVMFEKFLLQRIQKVIFSKVSGDRSGAPTPVNRNFSEGTLTPTSIRRRTLKPFRQAFSRMEAPLGAKTPDMAGI